MGTWSQEGAIAAAAERLNRTLAILEGQGLDADGHVGDMLPLAAIRDALLQFPADRIVISTHPPERSRWLRRDLVGRCGARSACRCSTSSRTRSSPLPPPRTRPREERGAQLPHGHRGRGDVRDALGAQRFDGRSRRSIEAPRS